MIHIAIIEDDRGLNNGIALALRQENYTFSQYTALSEVGEVSAFDLIILDLNLPDGNGFDFLKTLRQSYDTPVIILTANDQEMDEVMGLELGADDYMTKPFSLMVLRVRVKKALQQKKTGNPAVYEQNGFRFDFDQMLFYKNSQELTLSKTEQKLLRLLVNNQNHPLSRASLVDHIWTDGAEYVDENALSVTVKRLRDKLEDNPSRPQFIQTVYGIGYMWKTK